MNEEESNKVAFNDRQDNDNTLLHSNSFYLQPNIGERQIHFILDKVINAWSPEAPVKLLIAQQRTAKMHDMLIAAPDIMWGYYCINYWNRNTIWSH
ncbi:hypothetical protein MAM1_0665d11095 [Mucor ambiguus]|uniref:Uncharacterized protein n=1 Tax=Mucor ambiguus TaxID=91626 RepID=A0A0C9ML50_9FUNG|nr:hypothetical protein MAM1_0665d11095 [Mucor ambiguus]